MKRLLTLILLICISYALYSDIVKKIPGTFRVKKITEYWEEVEGPQSRYDYVYDAKGGISRVDLFLNGDNPSTVYTYENDEKGNIVGITGKNADGEIFSVTKTEYTKGKKTAETVTDKDGNVNETTRYYYNEKGQLVAKTVKNNWTTRGVLTWSSLVLSSYDNKGGLAGEQYFYDAEYNSKSQVKLAADKNGSTVITTDSSPDGEYLGEMRLQYDAKGQLLLESYKTKDNDQCVSYTARIEYDASGNVKQIKLFNYELKLIQTFVFEWEKGKFDKAMLEAIFDNLIRVGC